MEIQGSSAKSKLESIRLEGTVMMDEAYQVQRMANTRLVGAKQKAEKVKRKARYAEFAQRFGR